MAIAFRRVTLNFDPTSGQEQVQTGTAVFGSTVRSAQGALNGFDVQFNGGDHHLKRVKVDIDDNVARNGSSATVTVRYLLRDNSGNIDDVYSGKVDVLVIADVA
jgi:hypothetical protein